LQYLTCIFIETSK